MPLAVTESVLVRVQCSACNGFTDKVLSWLLLRNAMPCKCGATIDLESGHNAWLIQSLGLRCAEMDGLEPPVITIDDGQVVNENPRPLEPKYLRLTVHSDRGLLVLKLSPAAASGIGAIVEQNRLVTDYRSQQERL